MTTTSRERREAVAAAIRRAQYRWVRMETHTDILSEAMADAALAAALPDRAAFEAAVGEVIEGAYLQGLERGFSEYRPRNEERSKCASEARSRATAALIALVYGDDAQAGDQEGAEHE